MGAKWPEQKYIPEVNENILNKNVISDQDNKNLTNFLKEINGEKTADVVDAFDNHADDVLKLIKDDLIKNRDKITDFSPYKLALEAFALDLAFLSTNPGKKTQKEIIALNNSLNPLIDDIKILIGETTTKTKVEYINKAYSNQIFENSQHEKGFNASFDLDKKDPVFEENLKKYSAQSNPDILDKDVSYRYVICPDDSLDPELETLPDWTRVAVLSYKDAKWIDRNVYVSFGTNKWLSLLKLKKFETDFVKKDEKTKTENLDLNKLTGVDFNNLSFFDHRWPDVFQKWLSLQSQPLNQASLTKLFATINNSQSAESTINTNTFIANKEWYLKAVTNVVCEKSKTDNKVMQSYLSLLNPKENTWANDKIGNASTQKEIVSILEKFMKDNNRANSTDDAQKKMAIQVQAFSLTHSPVEKKEKQVSLQESLMNILKGDFENISPAIKSMFLMISEMFGWRSWLMGMFDKDPKMTARLESFYAKEYWLNSDKTDYISSLINDYKNNSESKSYSSAAVDSLVDKKEKFSSQKLYNILEAKLTDKDWWNQIDPKIVQNIATKQGLQLPEWFFKEDWSINTSKAIDTTFVASFLNAFMKNQDMWKTIVNSNNTLQSTVNVKDWTTKVDFVNWLVYSASAFLVAGSKEYFHNVVVQNKAVIEENKPVEQTAETIKDPNMEKEIKEMKDKFESWRTLRYPLTSQDEKKLSDPERKQYEQYKKDLVIYLDRLLDTNSDYNKYLVSTKRLDTNTWDRDSFLNHIPTYLASKKVNSPVNSILDKLIKDFDSISKDKKAVFENGKLLIKWKDTTDKNISLDIASLFPAPAAPVVENKKKETKDNKPANKDVADNSNNQKFPKWVSPEK